jgi:hypothetical protein
MPRPKIITEGPNPSGLCMCGCGEKTPLARQGHQARGWVKDKPIRYIPGHFVPQKPAKMEYLVNESTGCWEWQGKLHQGYAYTTHHVSRRAARVFYEDHIGPIPEGMVLDHLCRNRACVNPTHLEVVTVAENNRRRPDTKLTVDDVREIRSLSGIVSQNEMARRFGIDQGLISRIVNRKAWKDVA